MHSDFNANPQNDIKLQRIGAAALLMMPLCYICMFVIFGVILSFPQAAILSEKMSYIAANKGLISIAYMVGYLVFGCLLLIAVQAIHSTLSSRRSHLVNSASIFGLIWVVLMMCSGMTSLVGMQTMIHQVAEGKDSAEIVFVTYTTIANALGGGIEFVGGVWVLLVSICAFRQQRFTKPLCFLGIFVGLIGIITTYQDIPATKEAFGLSQIIWFIWFGLAMIPKAFNTR
ncbi:hypothetical protein [Alteromonas facilis]|uniref:hypothetical protein n=1 Tax=Alteromonas facilis TaxID=2048004 RepID=UPI000C294966|nr:hypothetical protein [Alteromonas facilis]